MGHRVRVRLNLAAWGATPEITAAEFDALDAGQYASIDGDAGGTWGPASIIEIGGAGLRVAAPFILKTGAAMTAQTGATVTISSGGAVTFNAGSDMSFMGDAVFGNASTTTFQNGSSLALESGAVLDMEGDATWLSGGTLTFNSGSTLEVGGNFNLGATIFGGTVPTSGSRVLLWQFPVSATANVRMYARASGLTPLTSAGYELTFNASWTGTQWHADDTSLYASIEESFQRPPTTSVGGTFAGEFATRLTRYKASTGSNWNADAWDSYTGIGVGNPSAAFAYLPPNTLFSKNIVKAFALLTTDGVGGVTISDGFGLSTAVISGSEILVTLRNAMANLAYSVIPGMVGITAVPNLTSIVSSTQFRIGVRDFAGAAISPGGVALSVNIMVLGAQ